jgi:hypothetical protein
MTAGPIQSEGRVLVMRLLSVGSDDLGVFAVGQRATGIFAFGQLATGVVAVGQLATGVIAVGQLARGVIVVGQLAIGVACLGQLSVGVIWSSGMLGVGATSGPSLAVLGLFGRLDRRRLRAWTGRLRARVLGRPWDRVPVPLMDQVPVPLMDQVPVSLMDQVPGRAAALPARVALLAARVTGVAALAVLWWFVAGHALVAALA